MASSSGNAATSVILDREVLGKLRPRRPLGTYPPRVRFALGRRIAAEGRMDTSGMVNAKTALAIAVLPIVVTIFFHMYDNHFYWPGHLSYTSDGIKCEGKKCELAVWIRNEGYAVDEDLKFELPSLLSPAWIYVSGAHEAKPLGAVTVLNMGLLHPGNSKYDRR